MRTAMQIAWPQARNVLRSRWLLTYVLFFLALAEGLLRFTGGDAKMILSLANIVLFVVPLVAVIYGTIYLYNSREFIELLLAQPLRRSTLFAGLYVGLAVPLILALTLGIGLPFLLHGFGEGQRVALLILLGGGVALTAIFTGIAFCVALAFEDRLTGLGAGLAIWLVLALLYDGALLLVISMSTEPLGKGLLAAALANPIDLVRIALILQFDVAALMGYTGAVFSRFFAPGTGVIVLVAAIAAWIAVPVAGGFLRFRRKDF
jgi:Cu-processing system permease protein